MRVGDESSRTTNKVNEEVAKMFRVLATTQLEAPNYAVIMQT